MKQQVIYGRSLVYTGLLLLTITWFTGCGGPSAPPPSDAQKSEVAQKTVEEFIASAKKNPKAAPQNLSILMESLEAYANEYEGPYVELRDAAQELATLYQNSADKGKISTQLEVLQQKSAALSSAD